MISAECAWEALELSREWKWKASPRENSSRSLPWKYFQRGTSSHGETTQRVISPRSRHFMSSFVTCLHFHQSNLSKVILEDDTREAWARQVASNATVQATDSRGKTEIVGLVRDLAINLKSVYGRFLTTCDGSSKESTGIMVVSYKQGLNLKKGQFECRIERNIRQIKDCLLEPLFSQEPSHPMAADTLSLSPLKLLRKKRVVSPTPPLLAEKGDDQTQETPPTDRLSKSDIDIGKLSTMGSTPMTDRPTKGENATQKPSSTERSTPTTDHLGEKGIAQAPSTRADPTPITDRLTVGDGTTPKSDGSPCLPQTPSGVYPETKRQQEEKAATTKDELGSASGDLACADAKTLSLLDSSGDFDAKMNDLDRLAHQAEGGTERVLLSRDVCSTRSDNTGENDSLEQAIEEFEAMMLSFGHNDGMEDLEAALESDGNAALNDTPTSNGKCPENKLDFQQAVKEFEAMMLSLGHSDPVEDLEAALASAGDSEVVNDIPANSDERPKSELGGSCVPSSTARDTLTTTLLATERFASTPDRQTESLGKQAEAERGRGASSMGEFTPAKPPMSSLQAAIAKSKCSPKLSAATPPFRPQQSAPPLSKDMGSERTSGTKSSGKSASPTTVMLPPQKVCSSVLAGNQEGKHPAKTRLWWADACQEDDGDEAVAFRPSPRSVDVAASSKASVEDMMIANFHHSFDDKLKKAFPPYSAEDDCQQNFLEVSDMWNKQIQREGYGKPFAEISVGSKRILVDIVFYAVRRYNKENRKDLAVRKGSINLDLLKTLTIFKDRDAAKRKDIEFRKTKLCRFWPKGLCTRGGECPFAHGEHELVGE